MSGLSFDRLIEEQKLGISRTEQDIEKLQIYKNEHTDLIPKLLELQKCLSKPAYLPFSQRAFIPGRLIHTNELLVHLGGYANHFAELSTHQTVALLERRIAKFDTQIDTLEQQKKLIQDRLFYSMKFSKDPAHILTPEVEPKFHCAEIPEDGQEVEIQENIDSDAELDWYEKHKEYRRVEREYMRRIPTPPLKDRKVRFEVPENSSEMSNALSDESSEDEIPETSIRFEHSSNPSPIRRRTIQDASSLTVAEAVDMAVGLAKYKHIEPIDSRPFCNVVERSGKANVQMPAVVSAEPISDKPVSKFKKSRKQAHAR